MCTVKAFDSMRIFSPLERGAIAKVLLKSLFHMLPMNFRFVYKPQHFDSKVTNPSACQNYENRRLRAPNTTQPSVYVIMDENVRLLLSKDSCITPKIATIIWITPGLYTNFYSSVLHLLYELLGLLSWLTERGSSTPERGWKTSKKFYTGVIKNL